MERDAEIANLKKLASEALAEHKAALEKSATELKSATERAAKAVETVIDLEIDKLVGKKLSPAEKPGHVELAKEIGLERVLKMIGDRPDISSLTTHVVGADGNSGNTTSEKGGASARLATAAQS